MQRSLLLPVLTITLLFILVDAQNIPPRLSIPGAIPVPVPASAARPQFRNEKLVRVRRPQIAQRAQELNYAIPAQETRRPIALRQRQSQPDYNTPLPQPSPRVIEESKPVTEAPDDEAPDAFLPHLLREQQLAQTQQAHFQQAAASFLNSDLNGIQELHTTVRDEPIILPSSTPISLGGAPSVLRFSERPEFISQPQSSPSPRPQFNDYGIGRFNGGERPQPFPAPVTVAPTPRPIQNFVRTRPVIREPRPQYEPQTAPLEHNQIPVNRPRPAAPRPIQSRPIEQNHLAGEEREPQQNKRRPVVAQTIRKWREENEDGSITWGYENDDGSFKEELIGIDCVTKGTYGYVDPDGNKREYHYETGIKCDPNTRETEEEAEENGFINYEENKAVLPNGLEIDMSQLGKKKSRRPGAIQPQQNQYFSN